MQGIILSVVKTPEADVTVRSVNLVPQFGANSEILVFTLVAELYLISVELVVTSLSIGDEEIRGTT